MNGFRKRLLAILVVTASSIAAAILMFKGGSATEHENARDLRVPILVRNSEQAEQPTPESVSSSAPEHEGEPAPSHLLAPENFDFWSSGSEGVGPHISAVIEKKDGSRALAAVLALERCRNIDNMVAGVFRAKEANTKTDLNGGYIQVVNMLQGQQRACQTVTPQIDSLHNQLLVLAVESRQRSAASRYLLQQDELARSRPDIFAIALDLLRKDADSGDLQSMWLLSLRAEEYGASEHDRAAYGAATHQILRRDSREVVSSMPQGFEGLFNNMSEHKSVTAQQRSYIAAKTRSLVEAYEKQKSATAQ